MIARAKPQAFSMPRYPSLVLALWLTCTAAPQAQATPLADPPGLAAGAVYHRVFVTHNTFSISTNATSFPPDTLTVGGLRGADWDVTEAALFADIDSFNYDANGRLIDNGPFAQVFNGKTGEELYDILTFEGKQPFRAILSDGTTNANDRLDIQGPIYNMQNELIANDAADLWDGSLAHAIRYDELGNSVPVPGSDPLHPLNGWVWTGTSSAGLKDSSSTAGNWLDPNSFGRIGEPYSTSVQWIQGSGALANTSQHLYAFSPPLTAVPEPSSVVLAMVGLAAFGLASLKNRKPASSIIRQAIRRRAARNQPRKSFTHTVAFNDPATVGRLSELRSLSNIRRLVCSHFLGSS